MPTSSDIDTRVENIDIWPVDVGLTDPFAISSGTKLIAENLYVSVKLKGGGRGYGEIAPFAQITGETRERSHVTAQKLAQTLIGQSLWNYRALSRKMKDLEPSEPAARCGLETAMLDALCRKLEVPLWAFWGGASDGGFQTDVTIPLLDPDQCLAIAEYWFKRGFKTFKIKVGKDPDLDLDRLKSLSQEFPALAWVLDANQGFTESEALYFITEAAKFHKCIAFFEQPTAAEDLLGMAAIRSRQSVPIIADESACTLDDARKVIETKAADVINVKIMKSGVLEAIEIVSAAHAAKLGLMAGGMVETRVAMGCSLAVAMGFGGFTVIDLDTPLLLSRDPVRGGYGYEGPHLTSWSEPGLGIEPA